MWIDEARGVFQGKWKDVKGDLDYDAWRGDVAGSLAARGGTAVFSHYVAINAVISKLENDERVLVFRPDHASISTLETDGSGLTLVAKGREAFNASGCTACHGPEAKGNPQLGAPNLTDKVWLYGGSEATIIETITGGRNNQMPAWQEFLGEGKVHLLAAYVYSLSNPAEKR